MTVSPEIRRFPDGDALGRALAADIAERMVAALDRGDRFLLGCPGGRTPMTTYAALADEVAQRGIDLRRVVIVMMDDYVEDNDGTWQHVPADAHNSCRRFAREDIQGVLNRSVSDERALPDENVWFPDPANPAAYDARIEEAGGIDFFILASGAGDGHVAFNPPGSAEDSRTRIVQLAEQTRIDNLATFPQFGSLENVPTHGVTVGIGTIAESSRAAAMILIGADKQHAFRQLSQDGGYDPSWPATVFRLVGETALYADDASAGVQGS